MRLKDSIVVSIPLNVTVDLGYCIERTKQKRLRKLRQWEKKHLPALRNNAEESQTKTSNYGSDLENTKNKVTDLKYDPMKKHVEGSSKEDASDDVNMSEEEDVDAPPLSSNTLRREQFGGIIDYLEAKYVRGVVLEDPDEKLRRRERHKKRKLKLMQQKNAAKRSKIEEGEAGTTSSDAVTHDGGKEEEKSATEEEDLDYSTADDARSIYSEDSFLDDSLLIKGVAEQVQASSAYGGVTKVESEARKIKMKSENPSHHEGILADNDDAAFFVNVGDLEMDEDYEPAIDWHLPEKNKLKSIKKRKQNLDVSRDAQATAKEKKKTPKKVTAEKKPDATNEDLKKEVSSSNQATKKKKKASENQELVKLREQATELHKEQRKLFDLVVKEISEMTEEQMPRKGLMETIKVTLSVPEGKNPGDSLMFNNPREPNQRLKVTIPNNAVPGGSFMVSLPVPKAVLTDMEENNFSKGAREALHDYSKAFDAWAEVDWKIKELLGETKDLTLHKEKMKKFDELVMKFPDDLEIPVDIPFLRKVVRRVTQNFKKRKENIDRVDAISPTMKLASVKMEEDEDGLAIQDGYSNAPSKVITLHLPKTSTKFASISFNSADFK